MHCIFIIFTFVFKLAYLMNGFHKAYKLSIGTEVELVLLISEGKETNLQIYAKKEEEVFFQKRVFWFRVDQLIMEHEKEEFVLNVVQTNEKVEHRKSFSIRIKGKPVKFVVQSNFVNLIIEEQQNLPNLLGSFQAAEIEKLNFGPPSQKISVRISERKKKKKPVTELFVYLNANLQDGHFLKDGSFDEDFDTELKSLLTKTDRDYLKIIFGLKKDKRHSSFSQATETKPTVKKERVDSSSDSQDSGSESKSELQTYEEKFEHTLTLNSSATNELDSFSDEDLHFAQVSKKSDSSSLVGKKRTSRKNAKKILQTENCKRELEENLDKANNELENFLKEKGLSPQTTDSFNNKPGKEQSRKVSVNSNQERDVSVKNNETILLLKYALLVVVLILSIIIVLVSILFIYIGTYKS